MKRTTLTIKVELEGPSVGGQNFRNWLLDAEHPEETHWENEFRVVDVEVLEEDGCGR